MALGRETMRAMRACRHPWGLYIQADEVLHESGATILRDTVQQVDADPRVEGLLVRYLHFYGDLGTLATHRRWYRQEVRCVRLDPALDIHPFQDAQGFRVGPENRKIRARPTGAVMYHYGWARPPNRSRRSVSSPAVSIPRRNSGTIAHCCPGYRCCSPSPASIPRWRGTGCANACRRPASDA